MREIPILFSTAMVQALLEGRKTMTRRVIKPQPEDGLHNDTLMPRSIDSELKGWNGVVDATGESRGWRCPYGETGDVLWVRESWNTLGEFTRKPEYDVMDIDDFVYKAGDIRIDKWKPSIHMPKTAARIWLEVVGVRVERLHEITPGDAADEGVNRWNEDFVSEPGAVQADYENYLWRDDPSYEDFHFPSYPNPIESFKSLWKKINGVESWDSNPWVWVVEFKVLSTTGKPVSDGV